MVYLLGLGTAVPAGAISQADAARHALWLYPHSEEEKRLLPIFYERTGVKERGSVLLEGKDGLLAPFFSQTKEEEERGPTTEERMKEFTRKAPGLAIEASQKAVQDAGIEIRSIRHLVTVSCTGFSSPGFDLELIKSLGLARDITRTQVGFMGCHGAVNGLRTAQALALTHPGESALVSSVEISSIHYAYGWKTEKVVANSLFADGAGSAVFSTCEPKNPWRLQATGSYVFPDSEDAMSWRIGNHGFEMGLSARVPELIGANLKGWLVPWLARHHLKITDIPSWAVHPGGPKVLDVVKSALNLPADALSFSRKILAEHGNMSSATILFLLEALRKEKAGLPCLALAFGPGLTAEAALFNLKEKS